MKMNIFFVSSGSEVVEYMFSDLVNCSDINYSHEPIVKMNNLLKKIFILYSKINNKINLHVNWIWYSLFSLSQLSLSKGDLIILVNGTLNYYDSKYINKIRKKSGVKFACVFLDPINRLANCRILNQVKLSNFDYIGTFDKGNAESMNWNYIGNVYSRKNMESDNEPEIDLYFLGVNKDNRLDILSQIVDKSGGLRKRFILSGHCLRDTWKEDILCKSISYKENISNVMMSNCLLELVQEGQVGATARYCEAVVYGKKLLTNNRDVRSLPFYNEKYIKIFNTVDEIDFDWVREYVHIDFQYKDEFSPNHIINQIQRHFEREN